MSAIRSLVVIALIACCCDAAVLLRFVNMVPQRTNAGLNGQALSEGAWQQDTRVDRVGLQYFPTNTGKQVVWTESSTATNAAKFGTSGGETNVAPFSWTFAMPPIRGAHTVSDPAPTATVVVTDRITMLSSEPSTSFLDTLSQDGLKADGISGYLSFAAGTYKMSAYGVIGGTVLDAAAANNPATRPSFDLGVATDFSFEDGKVYTLVAIGDAQFGATVAGTSNTVQLVKFEESIASTTFAKAAIRFFNGASKFPSLNFALTGTSVAVSGVAYAAVSDYVDVVATKSVHISIASAATPTKDEAAVATTTDFRAGSRVTLFCGFNNALETTPSCRQIPSRVVAYVRLVNDASNSNVVQGGFSGQTFAQTKLNLWASFEYPRPEQTAQWSKDLGETMNTGHPLTTRGLYPVIVNVKGNTVTGYGEVFVPLYIMDFAVRRVVGSSGATAATVPLFPGNIVDPAASGRLESFLYSPIYKRVSFIVKTESFATLVGAATTNAADVGFAYAGAVPSGSTLTAQHIGYFQGSEATLASTPLTDLYMEPGEFYTVGVVSNIRSAAAIPTNGAVVFTLRRDLSVDDVATDLTLLGSASNGFVTFVPSTPGIDTTPLPAGAAAGFQNFGVINVGLTGATATERTYAFNTLRVTSGAIGTVYAVVAASTTVAVNPVFGPNALVGGYPTSVKATTLAAGAYSYAQKTAGANCLDTLPAGTFTVVAGERFDIFVLNTRGCITTSTTSPAFINTAALVTVQAKFQSAVTSGHSTASATARAVARYAVAFNSVSAASSVTSSVSVIFMAIIAVAVALFSL
jgi:hypothetical protein